MKKLITLCLLLSYSTIFGQPPGWLYNMPIQVQNSNTVNAVSYQLRIVVNTQSLITASQMNSNGSDIRFSGACTSNTFYNYWIEAGINTPTTVIWVKIPLIAANTSSTIFMFYGNTSAVAASAIVGTFRGPNSATDSVVGGTSGGLTVCQRGFRFQPTQNLLVTHFGKYEPTGSTRYVTLFNYTSTAIMSQTQVSGPSATYSYGPMTSPLWLNSGSQYVLQIYGLASDGYYYGTSSQIGQHLTYIDMQYSNGGTQNTFPTSTLANYHYGYGDFLYFICSTLAITPTYSLGQSNLSITSPSSAICSGASMTLSTNASGSYTWSNSSNASSIVVTPGSTTTYSVAQTASSGCTSNAYFILNVSAGAPTLAVVSSTNSTCLGKTATLTASGALTYTWSNNVVNGVSFSPSVTTTYSVSGQNGCGTSTAATIISITPLAVSIAANPTIVCSGSSATITTNSAGTNYTWAPVPNSSSSLIVGPISNTTYSVVVSDGTCSGTASVTISAKPIPTIAITPSVLIGGICIGAPLTLTASGAISYTWAANNVTLSGNTSTITVFPTGPIGYNVIGTNSVGCISGAAASIIPDLTPTLVLTANPTFTCVNEPVSLSVSGATNYVWSNGATTSTTIVNPASSTIISVTGSIGGCASTETILLTVFDPTISISGSSSVCAGVMASVNSSSATTYAWFNGPNPTAQGFTVIPTATTIYSLSALTTSSGINCPSTASFQVMVIPNPIVLAAAQRTTMCKNESNTISVTGANTYAWSTGQTTSSFVITPTLITNQVMVVTGVSNLGCSNTSTVTVKINACTGLNGISADESKFIVYPNPSNGDFTLKGYEKMELKLINEIGQLIKSIQLNQANNYEVNFSGLANGIYFITGTNKDEVINQKIIIAK